MEVKSIIGDLDSVIEELTAVKRQRERTASKIAR